MSDSRNILSKGRSEEENGYLKPTELLSIMSKSLRQRWPIDPEKKAGMVERLEAIAENRSGNCTVKEQLTATKLLKEMDDANFRSLLDVADMAHKIEKFEVLSSMEESMQRSFADGPVIDVIVSDAPMAAIEHTQEVRDVPESESTETGGKDT